MKKLTLIITTIITILISINIYWWMKCALTFDSFEQAKEKYLSIFPNSISDGQTIAILSLVLLSINIGSLIYLLKKRYYLVLSVGLLSINALIFIWTLFILM